MKKLALIFTCLLLFGLLFTGCAGKHVEYPAPSVDNPLQFPRDFYAHPQYLTEWWYYTGHVNDDAGNVYGFELVFFQRRTENNKWHGLPVKWYGNPAYVAHFAITDIQSGKHIYEEQFGRRKDGLAGASEELFQVWVGNWSAEQLGEFHHLRASTKEGNAIDFLLKPEKPPVLHGKNGFSQKGENGSASYYISYTRMSVNGLLTIDGQPMEVTGHAWNDHEILGAGMSDKVKGWDWFSIQLDNQTELMLFHLNLYDGSIDPLSAGTIVHEDGSHESFYLDDFQVETTGYWTSPETDARYPAKWTIELPRFDVRLEVTPSLADQELEYKFTGVTYWEGSIQVEGTSNGQTVNGKGYVELTGYAHPIEGM